MSADAGRAALRHLQPIPFRRRVYGLGSIYGKTVRDSRLAFLVAAGILGGLSLVLGAAISLAGYLVVRRFLLRIVMAAEGTRLRPLLAASPVPQPNPSVG